MPALQGIGTGRVETTMVIGVDAGVQETLLEVRVEGGAEAAGEQAVVEEVGAAGEEAVAEEVEAESEEEVVEEVVGLETVTETQAKIMIG